MPMNQQVEASPEEQRKSCRYLSGEGAKLHYREKGIVFEEAVVIRDISFLGTSILYDGPPPSAAKLFLRLARDCGVGWLRVSLRGYGHSGEMTTLSLVFDEPCPYDFFRAAVGEYRMISDGPEPPLRPVVCSPSSRSRRLPLLPRNLRIKRRLSGRRADAAVAPRSECRPLEIVSP